MLMARKGTHATNAFAYIAFEVGANVRSARRTGSATSDSAFVTYLIGCVGLIIKPGPDLFCTISTALSHGLRLVGRGILMSMSNPLAIMFFLAFLPHFTSANTDLPPSLQILLLGTLFCALVPFIYFPIICAANALKTMLERKPRFAPSIKPFSGLLLVAVVLLLACA